MVPVRVLNFKADCDILLVLSFLASYICMYIAVDETHCTHLAYICSYLVIMLLTVLMHQ